MINSWKSFVYAVDQMRQLQRKKNLKKSPDLFFRLKELEREVEKACDEKITEWSASEELFDGTEGEREPA
jgi:hypothetical protein